MWWQIIPSGFAVGACIAVPQFAAWAFNEVAYGTPYRRDLTTVFGRCMFERDGRVTGAAWIIRGLESLPDD